MRRPLPALLLAFAATGCAETGLSDNAFTAGGTEGSFTTDFVFQGLRLDLVPTELPVAADRVTLLPQSRILPDIPTDEAFDAGVLTLDDPIELTGTVTAPGRATVRPAASLPGEETIVGLPATVRIVESGTLHDYRGASDADGAVTMFVMPGNAYRVTVVPDDPRQPLSAFTWRSDDPLPLDLDSGSSVYGRVLIGGVALADAQVVLVDEAGATSTAASSDSNGFYELRAQPGTYSVRCLGRSFGEEPELSFVDVEVTADAPTRLDLEYPAVAAMLVDARVVDDDGEPLEGITIRLEALVLDGLEGRVASYVSEKTTDEGGGVLARVPAGVYDVLVLPPPRTGGARLTPVKLDAVRIDSDTDLGVLALEDGVDVAGTVSDGGEVRLPGAVVACREEGFGQRAWSAVTNENGRFDLDLPRIPVRCTVTPPADRTDLALTRRSFDPADTPEPTLRMGGGLPAFGQVLRDDEPEAFVVVEVRDRDGELMGSALTDEEGSWQIQLPAP